MAVVSEPGSTPASVEHTVVEPHAVLREHVELRPGATMGRYRVLRRLGHGAMGVVYEAYDPVLDRKIALKLIRAFADADARAEQEQARLLREAQALARLAHPNVVAVHDVGRHAGTLFIAMELLPGRALGEWRRATTRSWREVVLVFEAAGRGLAAAHAAGLVHRDFKPDNVMVADALQGGDVARRVWVMDFGLAAPPTERGAIGGTPAYMSPEQFLGEEVGPRSDQFSFCVALFETLYGTRPFVADNRAALALAVCEGAVAPVPKDARVPPWIHAVVLRGLAKSPADRFATMDELLAGLRRDPTARRRLALAGGAVLAGALAIAGLDALAERRRATACEAGAPAIDATWNDDTGARVERSLRATGIAYASTAWDRVAPRLDAYAGAWRDARVLACRHTHVERTWSEELLAASIACLDERRAGLEALLEVLADADREVVFEAVAAVATLPAPDECTRESALARRAPLADDATERAWSEDIRARLERAKAQASSRRYDAAIAATTEILADVRAAGSERLELETLVELGELEHQIDHHADAEQHLETAYFAAERAGHDELAAEAAIRLVTVVGSQARPQEGMQWARHAEGALARLSDPDGLLVARLLYARGFRYADLAQYDEALADHERALALRRVALGDDHPLVGESIAGVGTVYFEMRRYDEAFRSLEDVLALAERAHGPDHPRVAEALNNLGVASAARDEHEAAVAFLERSLAIRQRAFGEDHSLVANTITNLGDAAQSRGDVAGAVELHRRALAIRERVWGGDHPAIAQSLNNMSVALARLGRHDEAIAASQRAVEIAQRQLGAEHPNTLIVRWSLARALVYGGRIVEGRAMLDELLRLHRAAGDVREATERSAEYVRMLWSRTPEHRARLRELAEATIVALRAEGPAAASELERLERWLAEHAHDEAIAPR